MNVRIAQLLTGLLIGVPFIPFAAHAQITSSLGGDIGISLGASSTNSAEVPIVVTHASAQADLSAEAGSSTIEASGSLATGGSAQGDLSGHADALAAGDASVSSIRLSPAQVALSYQEPAKLFGFISMSVPVTVAVNASGATAVTYPWYGFLLLKERADLGAKVEAAVDPEIAQGSATSGFSADTQAQLLDSMYGAVSTN